MGRGALSDKPSLLLHTNAPWSVTGYGSQTSLFAPRLAEHYDIGVSAFYGLEGNRLEFGGIPVYPGLGNTYGNETIEHHADQHFKGNLRGGLVLSLMDVWVLNVALWRKFNLASWVPVDHKPAPPMVKRFFRETAAIPIAMSEFGEEELAEFDPLYVPHGVDTNVYKPYDQAEARDAVGLPKDAFIVGVVAANKGNPSRKSFSEILQAFAQLRKRHSDAVLYLHTEITGVSDGVPLPTLIEAVGLPEGSVLFCDQYRQRFNPLPPEVMAKVYSGCDVLLNPARGEGFGVPIIEAQACGTPVIVTDFSAMSELCGAGWKVDWEREWTGQLSWQARPDIHDILEALNMCYQLSATTRAQLSKQAVKFAAGYDADVVTRDYFLPALEEVQRRLREREPQTVAA